MITDQAVILCGGRGERLRPLTDNLPKPLAPAAGRPFLWHLITQLRRNGYREVVLLTGYLGEMIEAELGDGGALGVRIVYQWGPEEWQTAFRLQNARPLLKEHFLLLYGDNYANFQRPKLEAVFSEFAAKGRLGCLSILLRAERTNVAMLPDGSIGTYDPSRKAAGLNGVEIGYALFSAEIFSQFTGENESFSRVLARLALKNQLCGLIQGHPYYSVSDVDRLSVASEFLMEKKILLIDRDGTINRKRPRGEYVRDWGEFEFIPQSVEGMRRLAQAGWRFVVISNQAGVGRGVLSAEAVWDLDRRMVEALASQGVEVLKSYYCFHHWDEECGCRKPKPGMLIQASREWMLNLETTWYIGDDPRDCTAAWRAGCPSVLVGSEDTGGLPEQERPQIQCADIAELASIIINR
jgi:D-glycero-D-manno-heptose 1,7-bisphosphate phosphatase